MTVVYMDELLGKGLGTWIRSSREKLNTALAITNLCAAIDTMAMDKITKETSKSERGP